jgi:hypothetical protein
MRLTKLLLLVNNDYYNGLVGTGVIDTSGAIETISGSALKRSGGSVVFSGGIGFAKGGKDVDQDYSQLNDNIMTRFDDTRYYTAN